MYTKDRLQNFRADATEALHVPVSEVQAINYYESKPIGYLKLFYGPRRKLRINLLQYSIFRSKCNFLTKSLEVYMYLYLHYEMFYNRGCQLHVSRPICTKECTIK